MKAGVFVKHRNFIITLAVLLTPAAAFASEDGHGASLSGLFWRIFVFAVFAVILYVLLKDRIKDALSSNTAKVKKEIEDAENACKNADRELSDYSRKIAEMGQELDTMKAMARNTAEKEAEAMISEAERSAAKFKQTVRRTINAETDKAKADIRKELTLKAIGEAEKQLAADSDSETKKKFISDNIRKIGA